MRRHVQVLLDQSVLHPNDVEAWKLYDSMADINQDIYSKPTPLMIVEAGYNVETHQVSRFRIDFNNTMH